MNEPQPSDDLPPSRLTELKIDSVCSAFEAALKEAAFNGGPWPELEDYLPQVAESVRSELRARLVELVDDYPQRSGEATTPQGFEQAIATSPEPSKNDQPTHLGRYRVMKELGRGTFGIVYKAYDEELKCERAIKVPTARQVSRPGYTEMYLVEARAVAHLDHPNIVSVHDVGQTDDGMPFVVYTLIEGGDLKKRMQPGRLPFRQSAELVATVAEALQHAHSRGVFHRDIKPSNILINNAGKPYVADFGLALREEDFGKGPESPGTLPYTSPEQARHEGHRVDGRSDVFSLGVVFYELLTGRRPFQGSTRSELLEQIIHVEPKPLRQVDDCIARELERICLKALAKKASERYLTALDLKEDLRHFLDAPAEANTPQTTVPVENADQPTPEPANIVPKGLRSFDAADAYFFLELLPGPRDRGGLPESIRFWKSRIDERDPDLAFSVGLIYGPSGCGKSSLVKAGLLPRLAEHVIVVYVEATAGETEARLLKGLHRHCPDLPTDQGLIETLAALRRARGIPSGKKVLIVLDQFEQWLHTHPAMENIELVQALRQCDGGRVQCLVMVRDDFWMAATRFFREMEVRLVEAQNSAVVDLFDVRHARKVLALFGEAAGALPESAAERTDEQNAFLDQAVAGLAQAEKVICVRLAVFAEMVKGKSWTPELLKKWGGAAGVGATFLEETFAAATAPPEHRYHQQAARLVLKALLPEAGGDIKGRMRSDMELQAISRYSTRPRDFDDLLRILDGELRLITPTDPEGNEGAGSPSSATQPGQKYYQLTHDYLVHSLRDWLTRKQKETWRGRAQLRLEERTALWSPSREGRFLPSLIEYLYLWAGVRGRARTPEQQALLRTAGRRHGIVWGSVALLLLLAGVALQQYLSALEDRQADFAVDHVLRVPPADVRSAIHDLVPLRARAMGRLREKFVSSPASSTQKLHAAFALAALGDVETDFLLDAIPTAPPREAENVFAALACAREAVLPLCWQRVQEETDAPRCARYAITQLHLSDPRGAELVLKLLPDPKYRTAFIHGFEPWHGNLGGLAELLKKNDDPAFRSGLSAALGLVPRSELGEDEQNLLVDVLSEWYIRAPDGGTHSAAGWALRRWEVPLPAIKLPSGAKPGREWPGYDWFVNGQGMTMLRVPAGYFLMGDEEVPGVKFRRVEIPRAFFVSDKEISIELFRKFVDDPRASASDQLQRWMKQAQEFQPDCAAGYVSWNDAVRFCNWLSAKESRGAYYREREQMLGRPEASLQWDCDHQANGYRLLTLEEWEYTCRAATQSAYCFGNELSLLTSYAACGWNSKGEPPPRGLRLPNAWGLFDMHGSLEEWCWEESEGNPRTYPRGGHWYDPLPADFRSGRLRVRYPRDRQVATIGFRVLCGADHSP